jgi:hypothetical protein
LVGLVSHLWPENGGIPATIFATSGEKNCG